MAIDCPRAIFLDLDGTLANSLTVLRDAYFEFLKEHRVTGSNIEFASLNGPPLVEVVRRLKYAHSLRGNLTLLSRRYLEIIDASYKRVEPFPDAEELLRRAKKHQCIVAIVTSNGAARTKAWLQLVGFANWVDFVISGEDVTCGKPNPEPYLLAAQRARHPPSTIIAIEDSSLGAQAAMAAGLETYLLRSEGQLPEHIVGATPCKSLSEVSKAIWKSKRTD